MSAELTKARQAMFAAYSHCLTNGDKMLPQEIADKLLAVHIAQKALGEIAAVVQPCLTCDGLPPLCGTPTCNTKHE